MTKNLPQPVSPLVKTLDSQPLDTAAPPRSFMPSRSKIRLPRRLIWVFLGAAAVLALFAGVAIVLPGRKIMTSVRKLEASGRAVVPHLQNQDLAATKDQLNVVKSDLASLRRDFGGLSWLQIVPLARNYYLDGTASLAAAQELISAGELGIEAIAPYADLLGLKGLEGGGDGGKTAQDRINFIVNTIDKLQPKLSEIGGKLAAAQQDLARIDPLRYPQKIGQIEVRSQLTSGLNLVDQVATLVNDARPLLQSAPYILGIESPRKYLVLFQNDAEIRATGGFLTGYAIIEVNKGKINTVLSDDIYKLDEKFTKRIPAPEPIKKHHPNVPYWYLRDQNLSPDFKASMETFMPNYALTGSPKVDGVIAVDTQMLVELLKVTGRIGVPGYGNFSADEDPRCNCPQVFYELQLLAGGEESVVWDSVSGKIIKAPANYGNRKAFLGPLMYSVLANTLAQPKSKVPQLVDSVFRAIAAKHVLLYFFDDTAQSGVESFNLAGRVRDSQADYLMVVDTNFSGAKTNIWVTYKADQKIEVSGDGSVIKTLALTYSNPQTTAVKITEARNLNGLFRDWHRVYVPQGSELIEATGYETGQAVSSDLGKTVFEGFFTLAPGNTKPIVIKYKLPTKLKSPYKLLIQKQGGSKIFPYTISVNGKSKPEVLLDSDKDLSYPY